MVDKRVGVTIVFRKVVAKGHGIVGKFPPLRVGHDRVYEAWNL
jgi:hypothetical protein